MRQIFILWILIQVFQLTSLAQNECASTFDAQTIQTSDPSRYNRYFQLEQHIANYISSNNNNPAGRLINPNSTIIIPVVVHVLHNGTPIGVGNNITDAQVISQIDVLNEDFRRLNADRVNTPAAFQALAGDPNFEFRLACVDPNGNVTNGIHRVQTVVNAFIVVFNSNNSINEQATGIKFTVQGGQNAWPTDRYLNMWVCNIAPFANGQLLGYAQFPFDFTTSPNTDGVVILNTAFGRVGNLRFQYDLGRTTTHEVGHWLNLFHIWGDDGTACTGSDQCDDTPNQGGANQSNCPGFPHLSCINGPIGDMFMNYMDYTVDGCKNIYTQGQANRMRAIFAQGGPRASFIDNYFRINQPLIPICATGNVTVTNPNCLPVTWSVISGPANIIGGQGTNTVSLQGTGNGVVVLRATNNSYTDDENIFIGNTSQPGQISFPLIDPTFGRIHANIDPVDGATSYNWYRNGSLISNYHSIFAVIPITRDVCDIEYDIAVEAVNTCGTSPQSHANAYVPPCDYFVVSPNPVSSTVTVTATASKLQTTQSTTLDAVTIYDMTGNVKKQQKFNKVKTANVNIDGLTNGNYLIEITNGSYKERHQLLIQR